MIFASKALRFIDRQRVTWRPTQFVSVNWQNYDHHFHTFLESTEYFSTLWGSPFPVNLSRKGTTGKKVRSINFFVEEGVRELRSQTAPVPFRCFNRSSEDGKIVGQSKSFLIGLATNEASSTSFAKKYTPTQCFFFIDAISPQCMCGALVTAPRFSPNLGLAHRL